jgi:hypothetical protein
VGDLCGETALRANSGSSDSIGYGSLKRGIHAAGAFFTRACVAGCGKREEIGCMNHGTTIALMENSWRSRSRGIADAWFFRNISGVDKVA